jgi:hypothetical protein
MEYFVGLDLGQARDHTAIAAVSFDADRKEAVALAEQLYSLGGRRVPEDDLPEAHLEVVHLERMPLGTPYPTIVRHVRTLLDTPPLKGNAELIVDATGVGAAVVGMLGEAGLRFKSVLITAGDEEVGDVDTYRVPKRDLVAAPQVLLQSRELKIAAGLPEAEILVAELQNFRYEITRSGNDTYAAWREGDHDDLVLALALAVWALQKTTPPSPAYPTPRLYAGRVFPPPKELPFPLLKGPLFW